MDNSFMNSALHEQKLKLLFYSGEMNLSCSYEAEPGGKCKEREQGLKARSLPISGMLAKLRPPISAQAAIGTI